MKNLAHDPNCDAVILRELERARIRAVPATERRSDVPCTIAGCIGTFEFSRFWYYWVAEGRVPLALAEQLYADPVGRTDVRVAGHCGCPPPREWVKWYDAEGFQVVDTGQRLECEKYMRERPEDSAMYECAQRVLAKYHFADDPSVGNEGFIDNYHIDSEVGLRLFVDAILPLVEGANK
jgi:hypothetical protein